MTEADQRKVWNEQQEKAARYCSPWARTWINWRIAANAEAIEDAKEAARPQVTLNPRTVRILFEEGWRKL